MVRVGTIVVTYNRKDLLKECLEAIINQTYKVASIILIDNNSTDGTYEMLCASGLFNQIIYRKLKQNIGGSGGFNAGFIEAEKYDYDWLWIMDDDTIPKPDCLEKLIAAKEAIEREEETTKQERPISYLASAIYGANGEFMNVPGVSRKKSGNGYEYWYKYLSEGMIQIGRATFVSLLISWKAVKKVGYPMRDYFIWGDDTEYTNRLTKYYGDAYLVGNSVAIHKRKNAKNIDIIDDSADRLDFYYYFYRNKMINAKGYGGKKEVRKATFAHLKKMIRILKKKSVKNKREKIRLIAKGTLAYFLKKYDAEGFRNRMKPEFMEKQRKEYEKMVISDGNM